MSLTINKKEKNIHLGCPSVKIFFVISYIWHQTSIAMHLTKAAAAISHVL